MSLKVIGCVVLLALCVVSSHAGQSAKPSLPVTNGSDTAAVSAERAPIRAMAIHGEGISDAVIPLDCAAFITAVSIKDNVVTFHANNHLSPSDKIHVSNLNRASYLNGMTLSVTAATPSSFSVSFPHADLSPTSDRGTVFRTDCPSKMDFRSDQKVEVFNNNLNYFRRHLSSDVELFHYNHFFPIEQDAHYTSLTFDQPSFSWGNNGGWGVQKNHYLDLTFNSRGIAQATNLWCTKHAVGDTACGDYVYGTTDGGSTAQSDEGFTVDTREGGETNKYFHGTVGVGGSAGATNLPVAFTSGQDATTDGAFLLDISKGTIAGMVTGEDAVVDKTSVHTLPVTITGKTALKPSTGIGVLRTPLPIVANADSPESIKITVDLVHGSFTPGVACLAGGWYPEQVMVTSVDPARGSEQEVTVIHKNPNPTAETDPHNPSSLWQGGPCGNYLSLDKNLARDGFRTSYPVVGATDSGHVAYVWNVNGSVRQNGLNVYNAPVPLKNLVRKGGVVTASFARANAPYLYNHAPSVVIAHASDPGFNGTVSSPAYIDGQTISLSWKQAGPDATAASATIDLPAKLYEFHLYPGAEILAPRTAKGVPLEPNTVPWEPGDVIENPHNPSFLMHFRMNAVTQHTPPSGADSHGELWAFRGAGISRNFRPSQWINENPCNLYVGCGGTLDPIIWTTYRGPYSILNRIDNAPMNNGAIFRIDCDLLGCDHPAPYLLFAMQNGNIAYDPATSTVSTSVFKADAITSKKLTAAEASFDKVSLPSLPDGAYCLGVVNHVLVPMTSQGHGMSCEMSGAHASSGAGIQPVESNAAAVVLVAGEAGPKGNLSCLSGYRCTANRGRLSLVEPQGAAAGKIARVNVKLAAGEICTATQNGGTTFYGIGSGGENANGFDITSSAKISGRVVIDYFCH